MSCDAYCVHPTPTQAHCGACHRTFGGVRGFDLHRKDGRCLDPATLRLDPDVYEVWRRRWDRRASHWDSGSARRCAPQTDEQGAAHVLP